MNQECQTVFNIYNTDETEDKLLHKRTTEICVEQDCIPVGCIPPVSPSMLCSGGYAWSQWKGRGGLVLGEVAWSRGGAWSGVPGPGGCLVPGGGIPASTEADTPLSPVNRITDACENITLPQLRCGR